MRTPVLLDHRGRPIERKALTQEVAAATVSGVRTPLTSYPGDGLNPVRLANILREADQGHPLRQLELAETVEERDPHILGVLGTRKRSVAQLEITVEDGSSAAEHKAQAEAIRAWLQRDELAAELFDMLDSVHKGYSFTEILWDTSEGQWQPRALEWRDPRWFEFERRDLRTPLLISENGERVPLPAGKFIYSQLAAKSGIPARSGLSRVLTWLWMFKAFSSRDWAIFTQTYGQPIRIGKYGAGATADDKRALLRAISNVAGDMAAMIPASMEIEFVESGNLGASTDLYEKRVTHLNLEASKAVLGQTTTTDAVSGGHAVSQEHRLVQEDIERSDAKQLSAHINRDLVKVWIDLQFGPQEHYPRVTIGRPEQKDVEVIVRTVKALGLPMKKSEAYELAGISQPEAGDELVMMPTAQPAPPQPGRQAVPPAPGEGAPADPLAEATQQILAGDPAATEVARADEAVRSIAVDADRSAAAAQDAMLAILESIIGTAEDMEDVRTRLLEMAPGISTRALAAALRQAIVVAELTGRADLIEAGLVNG